VSAERLVCGIRETVAYEYLNLCAVEIGEGLSPEEIRAICTTFTVQQSIF
jgi:hypothetical protein